MEEETREIVAWDGLQRLIPRPSAMGEESFLQFFSHFFFDYACTTKQTKAVDSPAAGPSKRRADVFDLASAIDDGEFGLVD